MSELTLDFSGIKGPVYTGRGRGEALRRQFELDEKEDALEAVAVIIPDTTYTVSSSFFLGLFGPSVVKAGSVEQFKRKFHFRAPTVLESVLDAHAARALQGGTLIAR